METNRRGKCETVTEPAGLNTAIENAVVSFSNATGPAILESSLCTGSFNRYSILACDPVDEFVHFGDRQSAFNALAERMSKYPRMRDPEGELPFYGGWIGFFSYEAGLCVEGIKSNPPLDSGLQVARFRLYDTAAIHDRLTDQWYLTGVDWPDKSQPRRPSVRSRFNAMRQLLRASQELEIPDPPARHAASSAAVNMSRRSYAKKVAQAKRYIEDGDIYQVNLTQCWTVRTDASPLDVYRRLRRANPSSHAVFLPWGDYSIISASPELFIELRHGHVVTRPIKGTRPRSTDPKLDAAYRRELIQSEKDHAELAMIIDLMRNDLGRVCSFGSIRVADEIAVEQHPNVFHRVATIEGDLEPGRTWVDLLTSSFPGGSVTGAPKIRAMQIINELEPTPRGVYCGSIGMIGLDGSMSLNIAIRTMVQANGYVQVQAGGAIVADSVADDEYEETRAKAMGMMAALDCDFPASSAEAVRVMAS